jgi:hypothetical protein
MPVYPGARRSRAFRDPSRWSGTKELAQTEAHRVEQIQIPGVTHMAGFEPITHGRFCGDHRGIPTLDGRWLILPRYTQPDRDLQMLLEKIHLALPSQPPPRITAEQLPARSA